MSSNGYPAVPQKCLEWNAREAWCTRLRHPPGWHFRMDCAKILSRFSSLVGGLEHEFYFSIYWECHHPNWRTHIFQRGRSTTNQDIKSGFVRLPESTWIPQWLTTWVPSPGFMTRYQGRTTETPSAHPLVSVFDAEICSFGSLFFLASCSRPYWMVIADEILVLLLKSEFGGNLVGGLEHFLFFHILGMVTPTD